MKNLKKTIDFFILSMMFIGMYSCNPIQSENLPISEEEITDLVGTWDKADSVRLKIQTDGTITAQRWVASEATFANNFAVVGQIKRKDNTYTITANKSNLAHLWSSQAISKVEGIFEFNSDKTSIKFKNVKVYPENLDVAEAVKKRLSNLFTKNTNPTTVLPLEELTYSSLENSYQPTQLPSIKPWSYTGGQFHFSDTNYTFMTPTPGASTLGIANNAMGQHIHVILDGAPYAAAMAKDYTFPIADGTHRLVAFASRSYHEGYKNTEASLFSDITVINGNEVSRSAVTTPEIVNSRPKGNYTLSSGDTNKILIDYMINDLVKNNFSATGGQYIVRITINQTPFLSTSWKPYTLSGLNRIGTHKITLDLYDTTTKTVVKSVLQNFSISQ